MKFALVVAVAVALCHGTTAHRTSPELLKQIEAHGSSEAMIVLKKSVKSVIDGLASRTFVNSAAKTTAMVAELRAATAESQKPIVEFLTKAKAGRINTFYITNRVYASKMNMAILNDLYSDEELAEAIEEIRLPVVATLAHTVDGHDSQPQALEWGVNNINAPLQWTAGVEGEGVVVSHIDTGVRHSHESLAGALRETHNWFDPYTSTPEPTDNQGHGTHTMATIVGRGGTGVAPKAQYISCRGCGDQACTEEALLACGQFTLCPTLADGSGADCSMKPALSSNSWGGGNENIWYNDVIYSWRQADIIPVFAIGNSGPGCRTANSPGDQPDVISVGATNAQNAVASFSSHGPTLLSARIKPEVSAPGNNVRSASHLDDTSYATMSGTSMATPHVAGAVALLLSKDSSLTFAKIETLLEQNNLRPRIEQILCTGGGVNMTYPWPNNSFGWGKIDVNLASNAA